MKLVVTGASGYIGKRLIFLARRCGYHPITLSRFQQLPPGASWLHYDLSSGDSINLPVDTNVVVHLAANTTLSSSLSEDGEVAAAKRLIRSAEKAGAKFIFVSSQSARVDAPTAYGRVKWRIEQEVLEAGGLVVRPGQVYGGELRGLYGTLVRFVERFPLLPAFIPTPLVQPIHLDDLAEGLLRIAEQGDAKSRVYCLASPVPISFSFFLSNIARSRLRCRRLFFPLPVVVINLFVELLGEVWRTRFGLYRLGSLFNLPVMITTSDLNHLDLRLRPLSAGLHPSGDDRRRRLMREGRSLLAYIFKGQPSNSLLRRYVRAVEYSHGGRELGLTETLLNYPMLLSLLGKRSWPDAKMRLEFEWRMNTATILAEATQRGATRFLGACQTYGPLTSVLLIMNAFAGEAFWCLLRFFVSPIMRYSLTRAKGFLER